MSIRRLLMLTIASAATLALMAFPSPAQPDQPSTGPPDDVTRENFRERLIDQYDTSDPRIDLDDLLAPGVWTDGIPPLTRPDRALASDANFPGPEGRVVALEINGEAVAYPLGVLNWHEIVNDEVGGRPVAVTYCPLCDSAAVASRTIETEGGETMTLGFGVSGLLHNSNVVMYDRQTRSLWSQVAMKALTGPLAGTTLDYLPVRVITFAEFVKQRPDGAVITTQTGYDRPYDANPYLDYFNDPERIFHEFSFDDRLDAKALGLGVLVENSAYFVPAKAVQRRGGTYTLSTARGDVVVRRTGAGLAVEKAPKGVNTIQTFWHSWSAFHPATEIRPSG